MKIKSIVILSAALFCLSGGRNVSGETGSGGPILPENKEDTAVKRDEEVVIRVVYNNIVEDDACRGEWGFGCVIDGFEKKILFDTGGDGKVLLKNMKKMGIDPQSIDIVVISHEHQDHIGGLEKFLEKNDQVIVFAPASFSEKYTELVKRMKIRNVPVKGAVELCRNVYTSGEQGEEIIEQALFLNTGLGTVVITGCAHPGIVPISDMARRLLSGPPLLVMGGFHLGNKSDEELKDVVEKMKSMGVASVGPSHCTGDRAIAEFRKEYGIKFVETGAGAVIEVSRLKRN
ncbi:MAG: MBL fold metallo-hydrolase [Candidatus Krumholzibacteriota bacterium]|nr:MBL fold metallo-hydrolase [Candidatus Krumholzibacteriota bacterium]